MEIRPPPPPPVPLSPLLEVLLREAEASGPDQGPVTGRELAQLSDNTLDLTRGLCAMTCLTGGDEGRRRAAGRRGGGAAEAELDRASEWRERREAKGRQVSPPPPPPLLTQAAHGTFDSRRAR